MRTGGVSPLVTLLFHSGHQWALESYQGHH